ncbi:MAG: PPC domain-containing protein, partial [Anaerolineales bacterium]
TVPTATSYILEESNNPYFVDPLVVYNGPLTEKQVKNQAGGSWSYRVRAVSDTDQSPWSDSESALVRYQVFLPMAFNGFPLTADCTPDPAGDSDNINDALTICSGQPVTGQVSDDDWDDVFQIDTVEGQMLTIALSGSGGDADLYLYNPSATDIYGDPYEAYSTSYGNDEFIQGTVLVGGYWYIDVASYEGTTNYNLMVTLSDTTTSQAVGFSKPTDGRQPR